MNSQEAKQYLESQSNVVVKIVMQQQWNQLQSWYLETIQTIGLNEYAQGLAEEAKNFFQRMWLFHKGNMPKEEAQTLVREEGLHLIDLLEEREREVKMLVGVKSLRMKYHKKSWQDVIVWVSHATNLDYNTVASTLPYVLPALATAGAALTVHAIAKWFKDPKNKQKIQDKSLGKFKSNYSPEELWQQNQDIEDEEEDVVVALPEDYWEEFHEEAREDTPEEEDVFTEDGNTFTYLGKIIARDEESLREWMEQQGYFPNVWQVSDHGNYHLMGG